VTEAELINLFIETSQALDNNFEFWLTVSFALLVPSYLVTEEIPRPVFLVTTSLYAAATALFMARGMTMGRTLTSIRDHLESMGTTTSIITAGENYLVAGLYFIIMLGGTASTIIFVYWRFCRLRNLGGT
jgi:hypothetical protein